MTIEISFPPRQARKPSTRPHASNHQQRHESQAVTRDAPTPEQQQQEEEEEEQQQEQQEQQQQNTSGSQQSKSSDIKLFSSHRPMDFSSIAAICRQREDQYSTAEINSVLHLNYQGFTSIADLQQFPTLHTLFLDHNPLQSATISSFHNLPATLTSLFLQSCQLASLSYLPQLSLLRILNVSDNNLTSLEGIQHCSQLTTLDATKNQLVDISAVNQCSFLRDLLLAENSLIDSSVVLSSLTQLSQLKVLQLKQNPFVTSLSSYRRVIVSALKTLTFFDDRPVNEADHQSLAGWLSGGSKGELEARQNYLQLKHEKEEKQWQQWKTSREIHQQQQLTKNEKRVEYRQIKEEEAERTAAATRTAGESASFSTSLMAETTATSAKNRTSPLSTLSETPPSLTPVGDGNKASSFSGLDTFYANIESALPSISNDSEEDQEGSDQEEAKTPPFNETKEETNSSIPLNQSREDRVPFLLGINCGPLIQLPSSSSSSSPASSATPSSASPSSSPLHRISLGTFESEEVVQTEESKEQLNNSPSISSTSPLTAISLTDRELMVNSFLRSYAHFSPNKDAATIPLMNSSTREQEEKEEIHWQRNGLDKNSQPRSFFPTVSDNPLPSERSSSLKPSALRSSERRVLQLSQPVSHQSSPFSYPDFQLPRNSWTEESKQSILNLNDEEDEQSGWINIDNQDDDTEDETN